MKRGFSLRAGETGVRAASSLLRILGGLVDLVIPAGLAVVVCVTAGYPDVRQMPPRYWNYVDYLVDVFNAQPAVMLFPAAVFAAMYIVTSTVFTATIGNTPFSRLIGIRVRNMAGEPAGWLRVFVWTVSGMLFALTAFAGPLWTIVDPKRRMLHDILARVVVVSGRVRREDADGAHGALIVPPATPAPDGGEEPDRVAEVPWHV